MGSLRPIDRFLPMSLADDLGALRRSGSPREARPMALWGWRRSRPVAASRSRRMRRAQHRGDASKRHHRGLRRLSSFRRTRSRERSRALLGISVVWKTAPPIESSVGDVTLRLGSCSCCTGRTGVDFSHYKANTLYRRVTRRVILHRGSAGLLGVRAVLRGQPTRNWRPSTRDILIGVTVSSGIPTRSSAISVPRWRLPCSTARPLGMIRCASGCWGAPPGKRPTP